MELEDSVPELEPLSFLLGRLLDQLCARLEARSLAASAIRVRFELEPASENNFRSLNDSSPHKAALPTYEKILALPVPMRNSKMLLKLLRLRLQSEPPQTAVLKLFMAAEAARPRFAQGGLFQPSSPDPEKLELTIARLASLVGDSNVGAPELTDTHRPDDFRMRRFVAPRATVESSRRRSGMNQKHGTVQASADGNDPASSIRNTKTCFRVFRPSLPATVELRGGHPARISFNGVRSEVLAASGPWRATGDWWQEDAWQHDEWDIEIRHGSSSSGRRERFSTSTLFSSKDLQPPQQCGVYRIYYDSIRESWFVRGMYD